VAVPEAPSCKRIDPAQNHFLTPRALPSAGRRIQRCSGEQATQPFADSALKPSLDALVPIDLDQQPYWKPGVPYHAMAQDYQRRPAQFSYENAELKRLPLRSERMELMARALETLAQARELLIKVDETLARKWTA